MGHIAGHEQERAFVQGRHKLFSNPREGAGKGRQGTCFPQVPPNFFCAARYKAKQFIKDLPDGYAQSDTEDGNSSKLPFISQAPRENAGIKMNDRKKGTENNY